MNMWIKLTAEESHDFQIPWEVANSASSHFYSTATLSNLYFDGSWPLLGFTFHEQTPNVVAFQPCRVDFDFINNFDDYDPLNELIGHNITLNRQELLGLIGVLEDISHEFSTARARPFTTLNPLTPLQHKQFRIPWMPKDSRQRVLMQTERPQTNETDPETINLIILSSIQNLTFKSSFKPITTYRYHFQVCEFTPHDLLNESFDPLQHATNRINLESRSVRELAKVIRDFMLEDYGAENSTLSYTPLTTPKSDVPYRW